MFRGPRIETQTPETAPVPEPSDETARRRGWFIRMRRRHSGRASTNLTGRSATERADAGGQGPQQSAPSSGSGGGGAPRLIQPPRNIFMSNFGMLQ